MAASAMYHLAQDGRFDRAGIVAGSVEGFALVAGSTSPSATSGGTPTGWPSGRRTSVSWRTPTR